MKRSFTFLFLLAGTSLYAFGGGLPTVIPVGLPVPAIASEWDLDMAPATLSRMRRHRRKKA